MCVVGEVLDRVGSVLWVQAPREEPLIRAPFVDEWFGRANWLVVWRGAGNDDDV